ncbi:MAG: hypothetical protein F2667_10975 [Actinobacteria bacterium]|uniref:Unannotated protein n=1 Tax=freshwater metagenome TaxID=449393 RepID=A0A6J6RK61_9ZZZZ|nr:hypothetical protein [Actinomycetota bacterium]
MHETRTLIETEARQRISERVARSTGPQVPTTPQRHRLARQLRRFADRLEG